MSSESKHIVTDKLTISLELENIKKSKPSTLNKGMHQLKITLRNDNTARPFARKLFIRKAILTKHTFQRSFWGILLFRNAKLTNKSVLINCNSSFSKEHLSNSCTARVISYLREVRRVHNSSNKQNDIIV